MLNCMNPSSPKSHLYHRPPLFLSNSPQRWETVSWVIILRLALIKFSTSFLDCSWVFSSHEQMSQEMHTAKQRDSGSRKDGEWFKPDGGTELEGEVLRLNWALQRGGGLRLAEGLLLKGPASVHQTLYWNSSAEAQQRARAHARVCERDCVPVCVWCISVLCVSVWVSCLCVFQCIYMCACVYVCVITCVCLCVLTGCLSRICSSTVRHTMWVSLSVHLHWGCVCCVYLYAFLCICIWLHLCVCAVCVCGLVVSCGLYLCVCVV